MMAFYEMQTIPFQLLPDTSRANPCVFEQTIIVPTVNQKANVSALVDRLAMSCPAQGTEILFVDDSDDGTAQVIRQVDVSEMSIRLISLTDEPTARAELTLGRKGVGR